MASIDFEKRLGEIKELLALRDKITEQLYALISGAPIYEDQPVEKVKCTQCGKTSHDKSACPRLKKKERKQEQGGRKCSRCQKPGHRADPCSAPSPRAHPQESIEAGRLMEMFEEHYKHGKGMTELVDKYGITMTAFYRLKDDFKRNNAARVDTWVRYRFDKDGGDESIEVTNEDPENHEMKDEQDASRIAYDQDIIKNSQFNEDDVKRMVALDIVDRTPVSEICARFKINIRTFAVLTKHWRDTHPEEVARFKEVA